MPWTNRGLKRLPAAFFRAESQPVSFFVHLITNPMPTRSTNVMSELTQIANGNGYSTAGVSLSRNSTDFPTIEENDVLNYVMVTVRDLIWTASGGPIPADQNGARAIILCDDNATVANREVLAWEPFGGPVVVTSGQPLTVELLRLLAHTVDPEE